MCRNMKNLYNFDPPASGDDVRAASVQFVRKVSGLTRPSKGNEVVFDQAIDRIAATDLLSTLVTSSEPKNRSA